MHPRARFAACLLALAAPLGCDSLGGLTNGKPDAGGSSGSSSAHASSSSTRGSGSRAGTSSSVGDAGADAPLADASRDASHDASRDAPRETGAPRDARPDVAPHDACARAPDASAAVARVAAACALAVSCDPYNFPVHVSECISTNYLASLPALHCLESITDCAGYFACMGHRYVSEDECNGAPARCDPDSGLVVNCSNLTAANCKLQTGSTACAVYDAGEGNTLADCTLPEASCGGVGPTSADGGEVCGDDGHDAFYCTGGEAYGTDCTLTGDVCQTVDGVGLCRPEPPADAASCTETACTDAGAVSVCVDGKVLSTGDCPAVGLTCGTAAGGGVGCVVPGCAAPTCDKESCAPDGVTMHVCVGGAPYAIDCRGVGTQHFTGCYAFKAYDDAGDLVTLASCSGGTYGYPGP